MTLIYRGALHKCQFTSLRGSRLTASAGPIASVPLPVPEDFFYVTSYEISKNINAIRSYGSKFDFMQYQYQGSVISCAGVVLNDVDLFKCLEYQDILSISGATQLVCTCARPIAFSLQGGPNKLLTGSMAWSVDSVVESAPTPSTSTPTPTTSPMSVFTAMRGYNSYLRCDMDNEAQVYTMSVNFNYQTSYPGGLQSAVAPARAGTLTFSMVKGTYPAGPTGATSSATTTTADVSSFADLSCIGNQSINFTSPKALGKTLYFIGCVAVNKQVRVVEPISNQFYIMKSCTYTFKNWGVGSSDSSTTQVQGVYNNDTGWEFKREIA